MNRKLEKISPADDIINQAIQVINIEAEGVLNLAERLDESFVRLVDLIYQSDGRVIIGGIGKSGLVGRKIVATLNSTGTRSLFLHPVEALHGDLGMVSNLDIFLALSNSGETEELNALIPNIRKLGCTIVAFTGNRHSTLAKSSDLVIDVGVDREACPLGMAPTSSTTALLAMGDALAVVLINQKGFNHTDFQKYHPGGSLGQRLASKVRDIMWTGEDVPRVSLDVTMPEAIQIINQHGIGTVLVEDTEHFLKGIITDGDIRRVLAHDAAIMKLSAKDVMSANPKTSGPDTPAYEALNVMEHYQITVLPIVNSIGKVRGILHLHDILGKGEFKFNGV
jgi:arabinose-5-phosphate isomerase